MNLVVLQHLFLLQHLHCIDTAPIHLLHKADLTKRALPSDLHGPEVCQPQPSSLQAEENAFFLAQSDQVYPLPLVGHHRASRECSFDLHASGD